MDYNTLEVIIANENIMKINSSKELAQRIDHSKPK